MEALVYFSRPERGLILRCAYWMAGDVSSTVGTTRKRTNLGRGKRPRWRLQSRLMKRTWWMGEERDGRARRGSRVHILGRSRFDPSSHVTSHVRGVTRRRVPGWQWPASRPLWLRALTGTSHSDSTGQRPRVCTTAPFALATTCPRADGVRSPALHTHAAARKRPRIYPTFRGTSLSRHARGRTPTPEPTSHVGRPA